MQKALRLIWRAKLSAMRAFMAIACAAFTILVIIQIAFRYFLHLPLHGIEEMAIYLAIWTYFVGAAYGAYERSHISAGLLQLIVKKPRTKLITKLAANLITVVVASCSTVWIYNYLMWSIKMAPHSLELRIPMYWVHVSMLFGMAMMTFYFAAELIDNLRMLSRGKFGDADKTESSNAWN